MRVTVPINFHKNMFRGPGEFYTIGREFICSYT